jgi:hypothetical protein
MVKGDLGFANFFTRRGGCISQEIEPSLAHFPQTIILAPSMVAL